MKKRNEKQTFVWDQFIKLENLGYGKAEDYSDYRDKFNLNEDIQEFLIEKEYVREGATFIRSDKKGLLFRNTNKWFENKIPTNVINKSDIKEKDRLEFRWINLNLSIQKDLFESFNTIIEDCKTKK